MTGLTQVAGIEIFMPPALAADIKIGAGVATQAIRSESGVINAGRYPAGDEVAGVTRLVRRHVRCRVLALRCKLASTIVTSRARQGCLRMVKAQRRLPTSREFVVTQLALVAGGQTNVMFSCDATRLQTVMTESAIAHQTSMIHRGAKPRRDFMTNSAFFVGHDMQRTFAFNGELATAIMASRTKGRGFDMIESFNWFPCAGRHVMTLLTGIAGIESAQVLTNFALCTDEGTGHTDVAAHTSCGKRAVVDLGAGPNAGAGVASVTC